MVIVSDETSAADRDLGRVYRGIWRLGASADILVWRRTEFESTAHLKASLPSTILREGVEVYAA